MGHWIHWAVWNIPASHETLLRPSALEFSLRTKVSRKRKSNSKQKSGIEKSVIATISRGDLTLNNKNWWIIANAPAHAASNLEWTSKKEIIAIEFSFGQQAQWRKWRHTLKRNEGSRTFTGSTIDIKQNGKESNNAFNNNKRNSNINNNSHSHSYSNSRYINNNNNTRYNNNNNNNNNNERSVEWSRAPSRAIFEKHRKFFFCPFENSGRRDAGILFQTPTLLKLAPPVSTNFF